MHSQAVFLDRDGTIGGSDFVIYPGEFTLFPGVAESIQRLKDTGLLLFFIHKSTRHCKGGSIL